MNCLPSMAKPSAISRECLALLAISYACQLAGTNPCFAQDQEVANEKEVAGTIIIKTSDQPVDPPVFFKADAQTETRVGLDSISQQIKFSAKILQGKATSISLGLVGSDQITSVEGQHIQSWAVRTKGHARFLDLVVANEETEISGVIKTQSPPFENLPTSIELTHLAAGDAVGFNSIIDIQYARGITGSVEETQGFSALDTQDLASRYATSTGGKLLLSVEREAAAPAAVELTNSKLVGTRHANGDSFQFELQTTAIVSQPDTKITILAGKAAVQSVISNENYQLRLVEREGHSQYELCFSKTGTFPIVLDFVAPLIVQDENWRGIDFTVGAGAVVPVTLIGMDAELAFRQQQDAIVPLRRNNQWSGFLPASGRARLSWKSARQTGEGKLFFSTTSVVETKLSAGLLRQEHQIRYQVLQGELPKLRLRLLGPGEILNVRGDSIVSWSVAGEGDNRELQIALSQPIRGESDFKINSQTPLGDFPVRVEGLRIDPQGAIRHSGFLRMSNSGSVRIEPTNLRGLTQLAPNQFPGQAIQAKQVFVYRFPVAEHGFTLAADRVQPEVNLSQLVRYELGETERTIRAAIELDIREAPVRETDFTIPADYSVVSVTGAEVADYVPGSEVQNGRRNLKVIFDKELSGRQLVSLHLEKSETASAGRWQLPRLDFPNAKTIRGDIGVSADPGLRLNVEQTDLLGEKPLSSFPQSSSNLQHVFRLRDRDWTATLQIETLERSIQADALHLYSLSQQTVYGSALINYFVTGAPVSEWRLTVPQSLDNVMVDGKDIRGWRRVEDTLVVTLHQPVMGPYTLLVTFEEKPNTTQGTFQAGQVVPQNVQSERGFVHVVSPTQAEMTAQSISENMLRLDALELPAEFRLLSSAPSLGVWQYTERPFNLQLQVQWFQPGTTAAQVVEFAEAKSQVSQDGELVTEVTYYVKSRGQRTLKVRLPAEPVKLWEAAVNNRPVTARQTDDATLIPLPGNLDPNTPAEVRLRLGKPSVQATSPVLSLPIVYAPVMKTQWDIGEDEGRILLPTGGTVETPTVAVPTAGLQWVSQQGLISLILIGFLIMFGLWATKRSGITFVVGLLSMVAAVGLALATAGLANFAIRRPDPLQLSLPILAAGELVELQVTNWPTWRAYYSIPGLILGIGGLGLVFWSLSQRWGTHKEVSLAASQSPHSEAASQPTDIDTTDNYETEESASERDADAPDSYQPLADRRPLVALATGLLLFAFGVLLQPVGAPWFFGLLSLISLMMCFGPAWRAIRTVQSGLLRLWQRDHKIVVDETSTADDAPGMDTGGTVTASLLLGMFLFCWGDTGEAQITSFQAADTVQQSWNIFGTDARLQASGTITLSGKPGDQFLLLRSPAVLTSFRGPGLRLTKTGDAEEIAYVVTIPRPTDAVATTAEQDPAPESGSEERSKSQIAEYTAAFEYQLEALQPRRGIPVLTGKAAVQKLNVNYDEAGWSLSSDAAVRIEPVPSDLPITRANVLLGPGEANLIFQPSSRDVASEDTKFFVEAWNLYVTQPGVIDGKHRIQVRPSQGEVSKLEVDVPAGLTVSAVNGPVGGWQFDADQGRLRLQIEPRQSAEFEISIETQRSLAPLPTDVNLEPLRVLETNGEVGLVAIAFGADAQPEQTSSDTLSVVNLGDFDQQLLPPEVLVHRVFRYGQGDGNVSLRVAPVQPEVRTTTKQVLSLGDERVVLAVNFKAEISRAGLFQLSFPLPEGLEVESLTGASLHHWSELKNGEDRQIILHLNGKTLGTQTFSLTMLGVTPTVTEWALPRFSLNEATRQTGELIVRPTAGIRLRTIERTNISETDPRALGGAAQGALAFRLLQKGWNLTLGIENLDPWITGQILQEVTLREGQTRSVMRGNFDVQNASIRSLLVELPLSNEDERKTVRASGESVSDITRTTDNANVWQIQFKRRVLGRVPIQIEFERRGDQPNQTERFSTIKFPQAKQLSHHVAVRTGGRLEVEPTDLATGWQRVDWNAVPQTLREAINGNAPALVFRAFSPQQPLTIQATRHSLEDALKLRVAKGNLTTVLSPSGDQLTAVELNMEVIQRSSLNVGLPTTGELLSIFVNGESVNTIRQQGNQNTWQFYVLPGIDDRTATVRFVYAVSAKRVTRLNLVSPLLNVPLENIEWNVIAPNGYNLTQHDGDLELTQESREKRYDRSSYLSKLMSKKQVDANQASLLLQQANELYRSGQQTKARWAFNNVANRYALDAASNEDARVQLENLQTQQAIVGLNTRRQRVYINNAKDVPVLENQQLREAAADNQILQEDQVNFRPEELSQLLRGNTSEDNQVLQRIASRLVQHQRTTEPAPQAIVINLPEEGTIYKFARSVQVAENAPLELDLRFKSENQTPWGRMLLALSVIAALIFGAATRP